MTQDLLSLFDCDEATLTRRVADALKGADDGELFVEHAQAESLTFDNGRLKGGSFNTDQGFGLRAVADEAVGYAHSGELSLAALSRAADAVGAVTHGYSGSYATAPQRTNAKLYGDGNPIGSPTFEEKVKLLSEIDAYLRDKDPKVRQVTATVGASWQVVEILRADGHRVRDIRPMTRINISVVTGQGDRQESGSFGTGGRMSFNEFLTEESWRRGADDALRQALINLEAQEAPAGTMDIVLGNGWPGVMLHEAVGHGLEGDFNRKKTSAFAGLMGEMVAAPGVTVVDDGTINDRRGSITVDDEGTPSAYNVLIENGKLVGYMQDRQNARLMGMKATGNGRRQGYAHQPMPRMTNTYMLSGDKTPEEIIASVKKGIIAETFTNGQVQIGAGDFTFYIKNGWLIEDGKITAPIKDINIIGNGPEALRNVTMVGDDTKLDFGGWTCGKDGQSVPVSQGMPTTLVSKMTVGGENV